MQLAWRRNDHTWNSLPLLQHWPVVQPASSPSPGSDQDVLETKGEALQPQSSRALINQIIGIGRPSRRFETWLAGRVRSRAECR